MLTWYQAAYDPQAPHGAQWVVLQMQMRLGGAVFATEVDRWPTQHEAHGHARKRWEALA